MSKIPLKYGLDEVPPFVELMLYGLQWLALSIPTIIIIGKTVAVLHFPEPAGQVVYVQKLFFVTAVALFVQLLWGHRLPVILGPAAVLLVGVVAGRSSDLNAIYTSIMLGGIILFIVSITGLFGYLKKFFTSRVVAVILLLIAFTLGPTIIQLILPAQTRAAPLYNLSFTLVLVALMFVANRFLAGVWKSTIIMWALLAGSLAYLLLFPGTGAAAGDGGGQAAGIFAQLFIKPVFEPGIVISFIICFLALSINDLGSIQSVGEMIKPVQMPGRITRGIAITGLANVLSGLLGVIGPVNFSFSPGIIASTGVASRFVLLPAAAGLLALSFVPVAISFIGGIPSVVIGTVLVYVMCSQIAAGLLMVLSDAGEFTMESGLIIGLPIMLGIIISFLPAEVLSTFPAFMRPILGNGFVVGVVAVMLLENVLYRR